MASRAALRPRQRHRRAASRFAQADFFHAKTRARLLDRLQWVRLEPSLCVDLGAGPCAGAAALAARFPQARLLALDHAIEMLAAASAAPGLARVCAAAESLPLPDGCAQLVFCNLMLAYCRDPLPVLAETRRILATPGLFSFATLGPESFRELRQAWAAVDDHVHCPPAPDMQTLGLLLLHSGFSEPVLDSDTLQVTYPSLERLHEDLSAAGSLNHSDRRNPGLTGRGRLAALRRELDRHRDSSGRIVLTMQVLYGMAWAGPQAPKTEISVPLSQIHRPRDRDDSV